MENLGGWGGVEGICVHSFVETDLGGGQVVWPPSMGGVLDGMPGTKWMAESEGVTHCKGPEEVFPYLVPPVGGPFLVDVA